MSLQRALQLRLPAKQIIDVYINKKTPLATVSGKLLGISISEDPSSWANAVHKHGTTHDFNQIKKRCSIETFHQFTGIFGGLFLLGAGISTTEASDFFLGYIGGASWAVYFCDCCGENWKKIGQCVNEIECLRNIDTFKNEE
jgi:hypothetical protein